MTVKDGGRSVKEPALLPGHPTQLFPHGIYADQRQETGYAWYCPEIDWRFAVSRSEVENPLVYCPGCARCVTDTAFDAVREGQP